MIGRKTTHEGELMPYYQHELKVGVDSEQQNIFFIWPMIVVHKIDNDSPLYGVSAADFINEKFEIVLIFEGKTVGLDFLKSFIAFSLSKI